jgi:hypothetical protein
MPGNEARFSCLVRYYIPFDEIEPKAIPKILY